MGKAPDLSNWLTKGEVAVLRRAALPINQAEIAKRLCVSTRTVHYHLRNAYKKLRVHSRLEALIKLQETGFWEAVGDLPSEE